MNNNRVIAFSNLLRDKGVNVSIRSTETACKVYAILNKKATIYELKSAFFSVYIKDPVDTRKFDEAFYELFIDQNLYINELDAENEKKSKASSIQEGMELNGSNPQKITEVPEDREEQLTDREHQRVSDNAIINERIYKLEENTRLFEICYKLGIKIANQRITRQKKDHSYKLNMPRTIRSNIKYGGKMLNLITTKKPLRKSKHYFLVDVSGSCDWINNWFFAVIYGCYKSFNKVRAFDFDNKLVEMTDAFNKESYEESYKCIKHKRYENTMVFGKSNMTKVFNEFIKEVNLNNKSYVIILTDCRDWNGKREDGVLESAKIISQIRQKCKKVIILNPEGKIRWNTPTSCVRDYQKAGAEVYEIGTLDHLTKLITLL